jgi:NADPH:quinone reductase-like Zn-dependent oxidoreductase
LKAVRIHEHGGAEKLRYEEVLEPTLTAPTDVIVKLNATAVNRTDICLRAGLRNEEIQLPHILGSDGAGVVTQAGPLVSHIREGDAVCFYPAAGCDRCEFCITDRELLCARLRVLGENEDGTYAEYVRLPGRNCFPMPPRFTFDEAAAFPLVYSAAWRMLITNAALKPGEHVLILGIGGGVALAALQIAVQMGTHVFVTSRSDEKLARAKTLGADYGINDNADLAREVRRITGKRGVDVAVNCIGGDSWVKSLASLARGGRLVSCGAVAGTSPSTDVRRIFWNHLRIFGSTLGTRGEFKQLMKFMQGGTLKPVIDQVLPLKQAGFAHRRLEEGKQFGKIVLRNNG